MITPTAAAAENTHAIVADLLDPPSALPVLDVGAGRGNFTAHLEANGYQAIAIDVDPEDYRQAGHATSPFLQANLDEELPVADASAAGAVCVEVLEHLESPLRAVRAMAAAVADGGFIIVTTPNTMSWWSRVKLLMQGHHEGFNDYWYESNGHISPLDLPQLKRIAGRVGLSVEAVTYNVGRLPVPRLHQRYSLRSPRFRNQGLGESLVLKYRKTGSPRTDVYRG